MGTDPPKPKQHKTNFDDEDNFGSYRLNLTDSQVDKVAKKLGLPSAAKAKLKNGAKRAPSDGQVMLTYKGKYVRIFYKDGQIEAITPPPKKK
jgi:hypothetical protein